MASGRSSFLGVGLVFAIAPVLAAQQTWIVDQSGGGNFTDFPPAEAAARHGDTIVVRAGTYYLGASTGKALTTLGEGAPTFATPINVTGLPAGRAFVLAGIKLDYQRFELTRCAGRVHLDAIGGNRPGLLVSDSPHVSVTNPSFGYGGGSAITVTNSTVSLCDVSASGQAAITRTGT
jgi:hypothetical protein